MLPLQNESPPLGSCDKTLLRKQQKIRSLITACRFFLLSGRSPADTRIIHVHGFAQFPDIFVAIAVKVDEGLDVEGERQRLGHYRTAVVGEIIVVVVVI